MILVFELGLTALTGSSILILITHICLKHPDEKQYYNEVGICWRISIQSHHEVAWQNVFRRPVGSCAGHGDSALSFMEKMGTMTRLLKRGCRKLYVKTMHDYLLADPVVMTTLLK